jgi:hypothetical protein
MLVVDKLRVHPVVPTANHPAHSPLIHTLRAIRLVSTKPSSVLAAQQNHGHRRLQPDNSPSGPPAPALTDNKAEP